jgi:hypothetical protein
MTTWEIIKKYYPIALFLLCILGFTLLFTTCSSLKQERANNEYIQKMNAQNNRAMLDSITTVFDKKLGAYESSKNNYVVNELSELKKLNKQLYDQISKVKGDVIAYIDAKVVGDLGGISAGNKLVIIDKPTNKYGLDFDFYHADSSFTQKIEGQSRFYAYPDEATKKWIIKPDTTLFKTNLTTISLQYGFKEDDKEYKVFIINKSPILKVSGLEGAYIIKKQPTAPPKPRPNFGFGPYIGFGLNTDYNLANPRFGWSAGVSLHYSIWNWHW